MVTEAGIVRVLSDSIRAQDETAPVTGDWVEIEEPEGLGAGDQRNSRTFDECEPTRSRANVTLNRFWPPTLSWWVWFMGLIVHFRLVVLNDCWWLPSTVAQHRW